MSTQRKLGSHVHYYAGDDRRRSNALLTLVIGVRNGQIRVMWEEGTALKTKWVPSVHCGQAVFHDIRWNNGLTTGQMAAYCGISVAELARQCGKCGRRGIRATSPVELYKMHRELVA